MTADDLLYHYTTPAGLLGIVSNKSIWVSDAEFLNDAQELQFGRQRLYDRLIGMAGALEESAEPGSAESSRATIIRSAAAHLYPDGRFAHTTHYSVLVACFCEGSDVLSQWRGYAGGRGYAIGFDRATLGRADLHGLAANPQLIQVHYGEEALAPMMESVLANIAPEPKGHPGATGYFRAASVVLPALAQVKHQAFAEEHEWRLITTSDIKGGFSFRASEGWIVPYLEASLPVGGIRRVIVGPSPNETLRERGVARLLDANGLADVEIGHSTAPFRA